MSRGIPSRDSSTASFCNSCTGPGPTRFSRLPRVPFLMDSVESPAMMGPVTAYPAAVMVSWPSFSGRVMRANRVSIRLIQCPFGSKKGLAIWGAEILASDAKIAPIVRACALVLGLEVLRCAEGGRNVRTVGCQNVDAQRPGVRAGPAQGRCGTAGRRAARADAASNLPFLLGGCASR